MSVALPHRIACPHCGESFETPLMWSLHATRMPELRDAILAGEFQRRPCPSCGRSVLAEPTLLYTDFERHQWYGVFPTKAVEHWGELAQKVQDGFHENMRVACPPMVREWAPHFQVRVVFGLAALREKLILHDAKLDDRLVELVKLRMLRDTASQWLHHRTRVVLDDLHEDGLNFTAVGPEDAGGTEILHRVRVAWAALHELEKCADTLAAAWPDLFEGPAVDCRILFAANTPLPAPPEEDAQALLDTLYDMTTR